MLNNKNQRTSEHQIVVFPTIDIYSYFRFWKQKVYNAHLPLVKYQEPIYANNCLQDHGQDFAIKPQCRKFEPKDGLIYNLKHMKKRLPELKAIKVLICVSLYNESKHAINSTLNGIYKNLHEFRKRGISQGQIVVIIIQDGILKTLADQKKRTFSKGQNSLIQFYRTLDMKQNKPFCEIEQRINIVLDEIDNYDRKGLGVQVQNNRDFPRSIEKNVSLLYQNYWWPSLTYYGRQKIPDGPEKLLLLTCFKHISGTKLSTHLWFFEAFCRYLKPQFCVTMNIGTVPEKFGVVNLIKSFSFDKNIGGVTGFRSVDIGYKSDEKDDEQAYKNQNCVTKYLTTVERAQEYEYIFSNFLDKNSESAVGFLHVLTGGWAAYRYEALIKTQKFQPYILERSYFKMILNPDQDVKDFREANMYSAEDRMLSLGIYCQYDSKYKLKYVPDAVAYTDPMKDLQDLLSQRKKWINSSIYAFLFVFKNYFYNVINSKHNCFRRYVTLNISMYLSFIWLILTYISPSIYFFFLYALINQIGFPGSSWVAKLVSFIYTIVFLSSVAGSLRGKAWVKNAHYMSIIFSGFNILLVGLGIFNILTIYFAVVNNPLIDTPDDQDQIDLSNIGSSFRKMSIVLMGGAIFGTSFIILLIHLPTHAKFVLKIFLNFPSFIAYSGAYTQMMMIYSFCNIDDVPWGTKGSAIGVNRFQKDKVIFLSKWILINAILAFIFLYIDIISQENDLNERGGFVLIAISIVISIVVLIKSIFAIYHQLKWLIVEKFCYKIIDSTQSDRKMKVDHYWEGVIDDWKQNYEGKIERSILLQRRKVIDEEEEEV